MAKLILKSIAYYPQALAELSYQNTSLDNPTPGVRTFDIISMTDSSAASNATATFTAGSNRSSVLVTATNDGPVYTRNASPSSLTTTKSQSITNGVNISLAGFTVSDPDGGSFLETLAFNGFKDLGAISYNCTNPTSPLNFNFPNKPNSSLFFSGRTSDNTYSVEGTIADLNEWFQQANAITYIPRANTVTGLAVPVTLRIKDSSGLFYDPNSIGITLSADTTAPLLKTAVISSEPGNKIILSYDEPLNTTNIPLVGAFTVTGGGVNNTVSAVNVVGSNIVLTTGSPIVPGTTVKYTDPGIPSTAAIQDSTGNHAITTTVTPTTDVVAPTLASSPLFYNGNWGLNKFVLNFNEELAAASNLGGFNVFGFTASIVDPLIPDRTTTSAGVAAYQSGSASGSGTCILPVSEKAFSISFNFNSLSTSASLQVKYVDPVPSNTNSLKDLAGNHATNMVLGAWTNDNLSAVDASFTSGKSVQVVGGQGNDTMTGGLANDTFAWFAGDAGTAGAVDVVKSFGSNSSSDKLDISKLLTNSYNSASSVLSQWVTSVTTAQNSPGGVAGSTKIVIDPDSTTGSGTATQTIWLEGVNLTLTGANLDAQLTALKTSGVLIA